MTFKFIKFSFRTNDLLFLKLETNDINHTNLQSLTKPRKIKANL
jgi:hypothetical protein